MIRRRRFQAKPVLCGQVVKAIDTQELLSETSIPVSSMTGSIAVAPTVQPVTTVSETFLPKFELSSPRRTEDSDVITDHHSNNNTNVDNDVVNNVHTMKHNIFVDDDDDVDVQGIDEDCPQTSAIPINAAQTLDATENKKILKRKRRSALRDENLDTKKFTLADLIDWRPKTENTLRKKWEEKRQKMLENMSDSSSTANDGSAKRPTESEAKCMVPRVKINDKGEMVLDEESLVVTNNTDVNLWETVDDDLMPKKLNSMSFRKRYKRAVNWSIVETDLFYEVLSATGTDFGLMHEFISGRSRAEIKKKFHREEKLNAKRIGETLDNPTILDETLYARIDRLKTKIQQELNEKLLAKQKPARGGRGRPRKVITEESCSEES